MASRSWVLTGAPGSGKTEILDELRGDLRCVDEPARRVLAEERACGGAGTPERDPGRFVHLMLQLAIADHRRALATNGPTLFDRGIPDCVAYARYLGVDGDPSVAASDRSRYHGEVLLLEPWKAIYTTDDERTMSFADTVTFHEALVDAYTLVGYRMVVVPRASTEERAAFVMARLLGRERRPRLKAPWSG